MRLSKSLAMVLCVAAAMMLVPLYHPVTALTASCDGECSGSFGDSGIYDPPAMCPSPCPTAQQVTAFQSRAREEANSLCQTISENPNCLCTGGSYITDTSSCESVQDPQTLQWHCEWALTITYKATDPAGCNVVE